MAAPNPTGPLASKKEAHGPSFEGDSFLIATVGVAGMNTLGSPTYRKAFPKDLGGPGRVFAVLIYSPDGSDPGVAGNTTTVYIGENRSSSFPLAPGKWRVFRMTDPAEIGIDDKGASVNLYVSYGGKNPD